MSSRAPCRRRLCSISNFVIIKLNGRLPSGETISFNEGANPRRLAGLRREQSAPAAPLYKMSALFRREFPRAGAKHARSARRRDVARVIARKGCGTDDADEEER